VFEKSKTGLCFPVERTGQIAQSLVWVEKITPNEAKHAAYAFRKSVYPAWQVPAEEEANLLEISIFSSAHYMREVRRPKLVDCKKMNRRYPRTFWIPSAEQLAALQEHDLVKVISFGERFWVIIRERSGDEFTGEVNNELFTTELKCGDLIAFREENICDID